MADLRQPYWPVIDQPVRRAVQANDLNGAIASATLALEEYIRAASDAPSEQSEKGATQLCTYALQPPDGALTRHLPNGHADGIYQFVRGIFQSLRNPAHHGAGNAAHPGEVVQAVDAINYAFTVIMRLAAETYLESYFSTSEIRSLLRVRHVDVDGDGVAERVVTYTRLTAPNKQVGSVLVTRKDADGGWAVVPGKLLATSSFLGGDVLTGLVAGDRHVTLVRFAQWSSASGAPPVFEALAFHVDGGGVRQFQMPNECRFSESGHEVKDHLLLGTPQLITHHAGKRFYWKPQEDRFEPAGPEEELGGAGLWSPSASAAATVPGVPEALMGQERSKEQ